ncbi:dermokine isoform X6 [Erinaceus europaeus]|uniref:Dermokine isoform X6 n=1 Tax=Erinaceus europaeus TaxID=9365 RepID=A0ABM3WYU0_ERIEU|nr:dermokine isoform X6 [Erinaceus europaeus]
MKLQGSLACLLLALCLGCGEAGPLLTGGQGAGVAAGEAVGQGAGEAASSGVRGAMDPGVGEAIYRGVGEAVHSLGNTGGEAGRQAETVIRQGMDAVHGAWQGAPGSNVPGSWQGAPGSNSGTWGSSGGHGFQGGISGWQGQGHPWGSGTPWSQEPPPGSDGSLGGSSQGGSWSQGGNGVGPFNMGTNAQGAVAQPGYDSVRGSGNPNNECINSPPSGSDGSSGNSGGSSSNGGSNGSGSGSSGSGGSNSNGGSSSYGGNNGYGSNNGYNGNSGYGGTSGYSDSYSNNNGYSGSSSGSSGQVSNTGSSSGSSGGGSNGRNTPGCENSGNEVRVSSGSAGQAYRGAQGGGSGDIREISTQANRILARTQGSYQGQGYNGGNEYANGFNSMRYQTSPGIFHFDDFWKSQPSSVGTRARLYFSRLWEDFKHNTPFLNWKAITEGTKASLAHRRASGNDESYDYNQHPAKMPTKNNDAPAVGERTPIKTAD